MRKMINVNWRVKKMSGKGVWERTCCVSWADFGKSRDPGGLWVTQPQKAATERQKFQMYTEQHPRANSATRRGKELKSPFSAKCLQKIRVRSSANTNQQHTWKSSWIPVKSGLIRAKGCNVHQKPTENRTPPLPELPQSWTFPVLPHCSAPNASRPSEPGHLTPAIWGIPLRCLWGALTFWKCWAARNAENFAALRYHKIASLTSESAGFGFSP